MLYVPITTYGTVLLIFCLCFTPSWSQPSLQEWALIYCLWFIPSKEISEIKKYATPKLLMLRLWKNLTDYDQRSVNVFLFFPVLRCYFDSHVYPHDSNIMQGSDGLCPSQLQMFIFILPSFTSSSVILFLSLTLTTVQPFSETAVHKRTRICPLSFCCRMSS